MMIVDLLGVVSVFSTEVGLTVALDPSKGNHPSLSHPYHQGVYFSPISPVHNTHIYNNHLSSIPWRCPQPLIWTPVTRRHTPTESSPYCFGTDSASHFEVSHYIYLLIYIGSNLYPRIFQINTWREFVMLLEVHMSLLNTVPEMFIVALNYVLSQASTLSLHSYPNPNLYASPKKV